MSYERQKEQVKMRRKFRYPFLKHEEDAHKTMPLHFDHKHENKEKEAHWQYQYNLLNFTLYTELNNSALNAFYFSSDLTFGSKCTVSLFFLISSNLCPNLSTSLNGLLDSCLSVWSSFYSSSSDYFRFSSLPFIFNFSSKSSGTASSSFNSFILWRAFLVSFFLLLTRFFYRLVRKSWSIATLLTFSSAGSSSESSYFFFIFNTITE